MSKSKLSVEFLRKHYVEDKKSTVEIAKMVGTYPETIRRALKKHGIPLRSRSKATRNYYKKGGENARKGYKFSQEEKEQASIRAKEFWLSEESEEAKRKIAKRSTQYWDEISDAEKKKIIGNLHLACREASQHGSRTQNVLADMLAEKYGYKVKTGMTQLIGIGNLEIDIALPEEGIVIEVDGKTHFEQVFSDNRYERAQEHDKKKNKVLTGAGWSVIRVRILCERHSMGSCLLTAQQLHEMIEQKKYKKRGVSYIEMK